MAVFLLDLSNELLAEIILYLHSAVDLLAIIRTSRRFREIFQTVGPPIIRQRFDETAFGGHIGLCAAITNFRRSWLRCNDHQGGCPDRSICARSPYDSLLARQVAPILDHEVLGFLNMMQLVDKAIDYHLAHEYTNKICKRENCPDCPYEYSADAGPCLTTSSESAQKLVTDMRCHFMFHDLYYRTYYINGKLRRRTIRLIKKAVKRYDYKNSPIITWPDLSRLLNRYFSMIGVRHHPLPVAHTRVGSPPIRRRRPPPFHFPVTYLKLLKWA